MRILLVSCYELGHQPLGLASPAAALRAAGHHVRCLDLAVESPSADGVRWAELVAVSVPMHTAARLGIELARRVRAVNPAAHLCFYGLYATPLHDLLTGAGLADSVVGGEYEAGLCRLADALATGRFPGEGPPAGVGPVPLFERRPPPVPDRRELPPLERYAHLDAGGTLVPAAYVEASRGCAHRCLHCPITPVYGGRLRLVPREVVLADVDQQVAMGARHVTFGDPDFLNAVPHSLAVAEELHRRHPDVTFDVTAKVEHLLEHAALLPRLRELGCLFVTSAFESCNDEILGYLDKGHTGADLERAVAAAEAAGLPLRPTWVAFTPWGTVEDFLALLAFVEERGLVHHVQPVQYALRLLVPPGSPLTGVLAAQGLLGPFDEAGLTYTWRSRDPRTEALQAEVARLVEAAAAEGADRTPAGRLATFAAVKRAALRTLTGRDAPACVAPQPREAVPGLTEPWFCCAEPTQAQLAPLDRALGV
ncbi:MAG TPA: CUAEP/CCAEP-tail radical SAM protein [Dehalococcoidia bacterium]